MKNKTNAGWIKIHRQLLEHPRAKDAEWVALWVRMLLMATHDNQDFIFKGKRIKLSAGQFITGLNSLEISTGINRSKVNRLLKIMEKEGEIETLISNAGRLISIVKWSEYQESETPAKLQRNSSETPVELQRNSSETIQECKNVENDKNDKKKGTAFQPPSLFEVQDYIKEKSFTIDAETFHSFYESKGWMIGKNKIKSWQACVSTWQRKESMPQKRSIKNERANRNVGANKTRKGSDYEKLAQ